MDDYYDLNEIIWDLSSGLLRTIHMVLSEVRTSGGCRAFSCHSPSDVHDRDSQQQIPVGHQKRILRTFNNVSSFLGLASIALNPASTHVAMA